MKPSDWTLVGFVVVIGTYLGAIVWSTTQKRTARRAGLLVGLVVWAVTGLCILDVWSRQRQSEKRLEWRRANPGVRPR